MSLLGLLVLVLIICVVFWAATRLMAAFGVGEPLHTVVIVVLVILCLYLLASQLGLAPNLRLR